MATAVGEIETLIAYVHGVGGDWVVSWLLEAGRSTIFGILWNLGSVRIDPCDIRTGAKDKRNCLVVAANCDCCLISADDC
jgi:hypothetical protein